MIVVYMFCRVVVIRRINKKKKKKIKIKEIKKIKKIKTRVAPCRALAWSPPRKL
jgi:hypothetical protein